MTPTHLLQDLGQVKCSQDISTHIDTAQTNSIEPYATAATPATRLFPVDAVAKKKVGRIQ